MILLRGTLKIEQQTPRVYCHEVLNYIRHPNLRRCPTESCCLGCACLWTSQGKVEQYTSCPLHLQTNRPLYEQPSLSLAPSPNCFTLIFPRWTATILTYSHFLLRQASSILSQYEHQSCEELVTGFISSSSCSSSGACGTSREMMVWAVSVRSLMLGRKQQSYINLLWFFWRQTVTREEISHTCWEEFYHQLRLQPEKCNKFMTHSRSYCNVRPSLKKFCYSCFI